MSWDFRVLGEELTARQRRACWTRRFSRPRGEAGGICLGAGLPECQSKDRLFRSSSQHAGLLWCRNTRSAETMRPLRTFSNPIGLFSTWIYYIISSTLCLHGKTSLLVVLSVPQSLVFSLVMHSPAFHIFSCLSFQSRAMSDTDHSDDSICSVGIS